MKNIDVFAHVLLPKFYNKMLEINEDLPLIFPFINHPHLSDIEQRRKHWDKKTKQVISYVNVNPEDYVDKNLSAELCRFANKELIEVIDNNKDMFHGGVFMIPMNNIEESIKIIEEIPKTDNIFGVQLFTRALNKSIADEEFREIFKICSKLAIPIWLHPVFDNRKPDNNIIFSWEYEISQAMLQIVQANILQDYPDLKIIVHHAGALVPFFAERINNILEQKYAADFKKFYVDTALLGNPKAIELTIEYFGYKNVLFGTDAPLGIKPSGATSVIINAINSIGLQDKEIRGIMSDNFIELIKGENQCWSQS